jgi:hypothetical protein
MEWEERSRAAAKIAPLKKLTVLPQMPGITEETARFLKWKSFRYLFFHKEGFTILRHVLKRPFVYGMKYVRSLCKKKAYKRDGDFFLYGLTSVEELGERFKNPNALLVVGFSYCQKPFECPSGRFTSACARDLDNPVCAQCDVARTLHTFGNDRIVPLLIPTVHYIGDEIFKVVHAHPGKEVLYLITACEMTLEMFGDFGNMVGIKGVGVRLDGRICNTMKAFELSEKGIKPGLTVLLEPTLKRILSLLK